MNDECKETLKENIVKEYLVTEIEKCDQEMSTNKLYLRIAIVWSIVPLLGAITSVNLGNNITSTVTGSMLGVGLYHITKSIFKKRSLKSEKKDLEEELLKWGEVYITGETEGKQR